MNVTTDFDVRAHFAAMKALGGAVLDLKKARDLTLMAHGNTMAGASIHVLYEAGHGLLNEMGARLRALEASANPETRAAVRDVLTWLAAAPSNPGGVSTETI